MYFHVVLLFIFQLQVVVAKPSDSYAKRFHNLALKHSAGLARDLRVAFGGMVSRRDQQQQQPQPQSPRQSSSLLKKRSVYCVSQKSNGSNGQVPLGGGGNNSSSNTTTSSIPAVSSASPASQQQHTSSTATTSTASSAVSSSTPSSTSSWKLAESHEGSDFFSGWSFFTGNDPTNGVVEFIDQADGQSAGLVAINSAGNAIMAVETTPQVASTRQSIRITTESSYNGGLFIMDSVHMPTGCGTWPAFWTNGPNWPAGGEIDIVEGVSNYTNNQATIHTNPGCTLQSTTSATLDITGSVVGGTDCAAADSGNQGCGVRSPDDMSFGRAFNDNGGGVYAMQWDNTGIAIWFWERNSVPSDITSGSPLGSSGWGTPFARWAASTCSPFEFFSDHSVIFDTTLCGDWAGGVWSSSGLPGQEQSCAQRTGYSTCEAFVAAEGTSFSEAYWEVSSVKIYQQPS